MLTRDEGSKFVNMLLQQMQVIKHDPRTSERRRGRPFGKRRLSRCDSRRHIGRCPHDDARTGRTQSRVEHIRSVGAAGINKLAVDVMADRGQITHGIFLDNTGLYKRRL